MEPHADQTERHEPTDASDADRRPAEPIREYRGSGIMWSGLAVIVSIALLVIIAVQNTQDVQFDVLWFDVAIPLILILAITAGIAVVATETIGFVWRHRRRRMRRERDELERLRRQRP